MAGEITVGGHKILEHTGVEGAGEVTLQNVTLGDSAVPSRSMNFQNKIINGDMRIDQRNAGASITPSTNGTYTLDRWATYFTQNSKFSVEQNANSITPPSGFTNYLGITVGASANVTLGVGDEFELVQSIEGYNTSNLDFGKSTAKTITLSFWVRSSLTGTFGGTVYNSAVDYVFPFSYTIVSANTWEYKTITIPGQTAGTWSTTNGTGVQLLFSLGAGSNRTAATANTWVNENKVGVTGQVNLVETNGATFYITGVQLEEGSVATPFEHRPIGVELSLCQRYAHFIRPISQYAAIGIGRAWSSTQGNAHVYLPVSMRGAISIEYSNLSHFDLPPAGEGIDGLHNDGSTEQTVKVGWVKNSNVSLGTYYQLEFEDSNWQNAYLGFTSEL